MDLWKISTRKLAVDIDSGSIICSCGLFCGLKIPKVDARAVAPYLRLPPSVVIMPVNALKARVVITVLALIQHIIGMCAEP